MKKLLSFVFGLFLFFGCENGLKVKTPPAVKSVTSTAKIEQPKKAELTIEGMTCAIGCAATIEKKLNQTEGIAEAKVSFDEKKAYVTFDETVLNPLKIKAVIEGVGEAYKVTYLLEKN